MKKALLLLAMYTFAAGAFCQTDTSSVSFVAYWSVGDSYEFSIRKTSEQWSGDSLIKNDISEYIASFEVVDSTDTSYKIAWTYTNELVNTWDISEELLEALSKYDVTEVIYTTTETGEFIGIENWKELGEMTRSMFTDIFRIEAEGSQEVFDRMMETARPLMDMYSSEEGIEQMVLPELRLLHYPLGAKISVLDTIIYEDNFPNLLGGDPLRADAKIWFEGVDFEEERCVLVQESKLNRGDTMAFLKDLLARMGIDDADLNDALVNAIYEIDTFNRFDYYYYPGIPAKIDFARNIRIEIGDQNNRKNDTITIELL